MPSKDFLSPNSNFPKLGYEVLIRRRHVRARKPKACAALKRAAQNAVPLNRLVHGTITNPVDAAAKAFVVPGAAAAYSI